jgi:hypothetical protein
MRSNRPQDQWLPAYDSNRAVDDGEGYSVRQDSICYSNGHAWYRVYRCPDQNRDLLQYKQWVDGIYFWRGVYEDYDGEKKPVMRNLFIPAGTHAHFRNCVFEGVTYVATDESRDLDDRAAGQTYDKYCADLTPLSLDHVYPGDVGPGAGNNIVFENCTFKGPVVSGVPKDLRWDMNAAYFIGKTVFDSRAIRQQMPGATLIMPNFNISIGNVSRPASDPDSKITGLLVGGIVDIRGDTVIEGTVLAMGAIDHVGDHSAHFWGLNIGARANRSHRFAGGNARFAPSRNITITPEPEAPVPAAVRKRYAIRVVEGSRRELIVGH